MPRVDLSRSSARPQDGPLPVGRVRLDLAELMTLAEVCEVPLPFPVHRTDPGLASRLGPTSTSRAQIAYEALLAQVGTSGAGSPGERLAGKGLLDADGLPAQNVRAAMVVLAAPQQTVSLDVAFAAPEVAAHAWHHVRDGLVTALSTVDGVGFELAWFPGWLWAGELARVPVPPGDGVDEWDFPEELVVGHELLVSAAAAVREGRADVLAVLAERERATVRIDGRSDPEVAEVVNLLSRLESSTRGRLRATVGEIDLDAASQSVVPGAVGLVSWLLLPDGWRALLPRTIGRERLVVLRRTTEADLPPAIARLLAEVTR